VLLYSGMEAKDEKEVLSVLVTMSEKDSEERARERVSSVVF